MASMTDEQRREMARKGARKRWAGHKKATPAPQKPPQPQEPEEDSWTE